MKPVTVLVGAALVAAVAVATLALPGLQDAPPVPAQPSAAAPAAPMAPVGEAPRKPAVAGPAAEDSPGWMTPRGGVQGDAIPSPAPAGTTAAPTAQMRAAMERLQGLQKQGNVEPRAVGEALLDVERANGSPVMGGVRLDVLRQNMAIAEKMKALSEEITAKGGRPADGAAGTPRAPLDAEATAALKARLEQLVALQKQLRTDVIEPSVAGSLR